MAQVARDPRLESDIDYHLEYQFQQWNNVQEVVKHWAEMDAVDREVFQLEWVGITESRLATLGQWAEQDLLTPAQRARYDELLQLVARCRPLLDRLLAEA
jgi:hypothetical protein